ncbi:MAG: hypothetical protein JRF57_15300 [Deltaproteobacteria bacterium]|nr:hypothetical protein [Deltaproteobacteria bacterium]
MDKQVFEEKIFEVVSYIIVSARNLMDEPARYGPFRLVDTASRLIDILDEFGMSSERLRAIRDRIEEGKYSAMETEEEFEKFLESMVFLVVDAIDATKGS